MSGIFPGEMAARMKGLVRKSGIDGFGDTFARMTISNPDSRFALPATGDYTAKPPTATQKDRIKASYGDKKMGIEASLTIHAANVMTLQPFFHTPGNAQDAYNLPKSYVEQIRWSRLMFNLNPYIASVTELKAYYPVSKFKLSTPEPWVTDFYEENSFNKRFNLYTFLQRMNLSVKKFGEAIVWGTRKQDGVWPQTGQPRWVWGNFVLLEPELLEIKKEVVGDPNPRYFLRPNRDFEELVRRLEQNDPSVAHLQGTIAPAIIAKIKARELLPLDPTTVSGIQNLTDGSAERGTPPYQRLFVNFTFEDFVRLALMSQAQRYHFPVELWTIGNLEKNIIPRVQDLEAFRDMVASAIQSPPFSMFFPPIVDYKALGVNGTLMDIKSDMEYAHKQYLIGLGVNENMILGEALALDTPIPTPDGWTSMGELKIGDHVFARDGSITTVISLSPVWNDRPTYSIKVEGAEPIIADENHKWVTISYATSKASGKIKNSASEAIHNTAALIATLETSQGEARHRIPLAGPIDLPAIDLPLAPYTLGAWLGDGDTRGHGQYACHDNDSQIVDNIRADGFEVNRTSGKYSWGIRGIKRVLDKHCLSGHKHIPKAYLRASFAQRLALAQGLMDTDGSCSKDGTCSFDNTNYGIVQDLREVLLTLGLKPSPLHSKIDKRKATYKEVFRFTFTIGIGQIVPFRLERKARLCVTGRKGLRPNRRPIQAIDRVASVPTRCIQVSHPTGTFLAGRDFVVTHNSGIFSSNETAGNQTFIRLVQRDRDNLEEWMRWHFFEPLAQWNNLKVEKNGRLMPIIPNVEWEKTLDFKAAEDEREMLKWAYDKKIVDPETIIEALLNRNPEEIKVRIRKAIGGVLDDGKLGGAARKSAEAAGGKLSEEEPGGEGAPAKGAGGGGAGPGLAPKVGGEEAGPGLAPKVGGEEAAPAAEAPEAPAGGAAPAGEAAV